MLRNLSKSLYINERYNIHEKLDFNLHTAALHSWRHDMSIISDEDFNEMLRIKKQEKSKFSNAVSKDYNTLIEKEYESYAENQSWYRTFLKMVSILETDRDPLYKKEMGLSYIVRPFVFYIEKELVNFVREYQYENLIKETAIKNSIDDLTKLLLSLAHKCIVLEINVEREREQLQGRTPEERFDYFIKGFYSKKKMLGFYDEYIVLSRLLTVNSIQFLNNFKEMIKHLDADRNQIQQTFSIKKDDFIVNNLNFGQGDTHNQGKTVVGVILGASNKILYKPKNLKINNCFNKMIKWLNSFHHILDLKEIKTLAFMDHSYEEFIEYKPCSNEEGIKNYYTRFGQILGIFYVLNGTDIHMENLIAQGEYPVIVDLETLIQQPIPFKKNKNAIFRIITEELFGNVTRTLLLPQEILKVREDQPGLDISALNGREGKVPYKVLQPVNINSDEMKYDFADFTIKGSNNLPFLEDGSFEKTDYKYYEQEIVEGFKNICGIILENKAQLIGKGGIISQFKGVWVRNIFRDTSMYAKILQHTLHPDFMRDMLDREKVFENMWSFPFNKRELIDSECNDMLINDIPIFFNTTNNKDVINSRNKVIKDFHLNEPFEFLLKKIKRLNKDEINKQVSIIKLSFEDYNYIDNINIRNGKMFMVNQNVENLPNKNFDYLKEAKKIADHIISEALREDDEIIWMTINKEGDKNWNVGPIREDFYDGIAGIYLLLYTLYEETKEEKYGIYSDAILKSASANERFFENAGLTGYPAFLYAFSLINPKYKPGSQLSKLIETYYNTLDKFIDNNTEIDYLNGVTGIINGLIKIYENKNEIRFITLAIKYTEFLLGKLDAAKIPGGFSHGASSYALTLFRIWNITKTKKYFNKAKELLDYEQSLLKTENEGWVDLRYSDKKSNNSWCNGAAGIGISRLEIQKIYNKNPKLVKEINMAEKILLKSKMMDNDCFCHGNMGTIEFFMKFFEISKEEKYKNISMQIMDNVLANKEVNSSFKLRNLEGYPAIGLFTGEAGIAYQLLRINNPQRVPSILFL
ncbi:type 2 lanthipeptide synthetase LanM family protein [Bacillus cereus]|uniref:type 2 lanthipeptide synthetase LanM family protein n=1 Tax=Bacillus cereus TaxID=1396 RepID=UPI00187A45D6|nr:type 2 lanthipeptide synthetase LanM family protein [Bacillus cereus]MBE7099295.1 type 2 lantipeptide synthetase LanM [Bacillus cereus]